MILPHITVYTDNLPAQNGAETIGPLILMRPKYKDDRGLLEHELFHVQQWYATLVAGLIVSGAMYYLALPYWYVPAIGGLFLMGVLYELIPAVRLAVEVAAYRVQLRYYPDDRSVRFAGFISKNYRLSTTPEDALKLLKD